MNSETQETTKIAILTDSSCDLEPELLQEYGIEVVPLHIIYPDHDLRDRIDITPQEVYDNLERAVPKTSLPSLAEIQDVFEKFKANDVTHVVAVHISSGLSGTFQAVSSIAQDFKDMVVEVVDSRTLSMGLGASVLEAARELRRSNDFHKVVSKAKSMLHETNVFYVLSTLEYLKKGGRIGYVAGTIGELLNIKPIISVNEEGKYFTYTKVRGREQSLKKLREILKEHVQEKMHSVAIMHGGSEEEARALEKVAQQLPNVKEVFFGQISPALGVHTGPGLVGVVVYPALES